MRRKGTTGVQSGSRTLELGYASAYPNSWIEHSCPDQDDIDNTPDDGDPGQALYETWAKQPDRSAQDAYIDTLTVEQRGLLIDYRQAIRRAA